MRGCGKGEVGEKDAPEPQEREAGKGKEEKGAGRLELGEGREGRWGTGQRAADVGRRAGEEGRAGRQHRRRCVLTSARPNTHVRWIRTYGSVHRREFCFRRGLGCCSLPVSRPV